MALIDTRAPAAQAVVPKTFQLLMAVNSLDPGGDTFRLAMTWEAEREEFLPAPPPASTHIDVVSMGEHFDDAAMIINSGVLSILDGYWQMAQEWGP